MEKNKIIVARTVQNKNKLLFKKTIYQGIVSTLCIRLKL